MKKQYFGISRDHSGSMSSLTRPAIKDYNNIIGAVKQAALDNNIDTVVSVTSCGINSGVRREIVNSSVSTLRPLTYYKTDGGTPLFDSVGELIEIFESVPDYQDPSVTFLVMAITDGAENVSTKWKHILGDKIKRLQSTDRWTFVFRVPRGYGRQLEHMGIPSGNIQEWDQSERGMQESSAQTVKAVAVYYDSVLRGLGSSKTFYTDLSKVSTNSVAAAMNDISDEVAIYPVATRTMIQPFIEQKTKHPYIKGTGFYQLSKPEKIVQDYKIIVVRNQKTGAVFAGGDARALLGLPDTGNISLRPGNHGDWDVFIQSTSSNRILVPGTSALYWQKVS